MKAELARDSGDVTALWTRLQGTDLQISEWHGNSVYAFATTGSGPADYVQISLGRETEWRAGPIVDPAHRPWSEEALLDRLMHGMVFHLIGYSGPYSNYAERGFPEAAFPMVADPAASAGAPV